MKTNAVHFSHRSRLNGIMLVDCMVYIALFFVIAGIAFKTFYVCWDTSKNLRRNTDEITATLRTGERWREDVRGATGTLHVEASPEGTVLRIPQKSGEVDYRFSDNTLWRRAGANDWAPMQTNIKNSRMEADQREHVTAWRWEVQLPTRNKKARVVPLFTFEAVPQNLSSL